MLTLETFTEHDVAPVLEWITSPRLLAQFAGPELSFPLTHESFWEAVHSPPEGRRAFRVVHTETGTCIGHAQLYPKGPGRVRLARLLIGPPAFRGQGLGQDMVRQLCQYAETEMAAPIQELSAVAWNHAAIRCYAACGFVHQPELDSVFDVLGEPWPLLTMERRLAP